jgi:hypothetical protein
MLAAMRAACALAFVLMTSCVRQGAYHCTDDGQCVLNGAQGKCETVWFCSFPSAGCAGGYRFGEQAGSFSGECVVPGDGGLPDTPPGYVRIGGSASGLTRTGLLLRNNGGDDLLVTTNGSFAFKTAIMIGMPYDVTVAAQPSAQTCSVTRGSGTAPSTDVTDVDVR